MDSCYSVWMWGRVSLSLNPSLKDSDFTAPQKVWSQETNDTPASPPPPLLAWAWFVRICQKWRGRGLWTISTGSGRIRASAGCKPLDPGITFSFSSWLRCLVTRVWWLGGAPVWCTVVLSQQKGWQQFLSPAKLIIRNGGFQNVWLVVKSCGLSVVMDGELLLFSSATLKSTSHSDVRKIGSGKNII